MRPHQTYIGFALFSYGFRPLFLLAGSFAAVVIPLWMAVRTGHLALGGPFSLIDWHIHELLFGYTSAVIAAFLFTAIPNRTGRMRVTVPSEPGLWAAAILWTVGFAIFVGRLAPVLTLPNHARRGPNPQPR